MWQRRGGGWRRRRRQLLLLLRRRRVARQPIGRLHLGWHGGEASGRLGEALLQRCVLGHAGVEHGVE
jgi:hypothetical protein